MDLGTLMRIFEPELLDDCVDKLRSQTSIGMQYIEAESLSRMKESINAKYSQDSGELSLK